MLHLPIALLLALASLPIAVADEAAADCEDEQPWIGYRTSEPVRAAARPALEGMGIGLEACEGEQWDGQDAVEPDWTASCTGSVEPDPDGANAGICMGADPNAMSGDEVTTPVGVRASTAEREAYLGTNVLLVGRVALYAGTCGEGEPGLEGDASCDGAREVRTGLYARDNTPGNILATLGQCTRWIICYVSESDCSHDTYVRGAMDPPSQCGRDNTALGASILL